MKVRHNGEWHKVEWNHGKFLACVNYRTCVCKITDENGSQIGMGMVSLPMLSYSKDRARRASLMNMMYGLGIPKMERGYWWWCYFDRSAKDHNYISFPMSEGREREFWVEFNKLSGRRGLYVREKVGGKWDSVDIFDLTNCDDESAQEIGYHHIVRLTCRKLASGEVFFVKEMIDGKTEKVV